MIYFLEVVKENLVLNPPNYQLKIGDVIEVEYKSEARIIKINSRSFFQRNPAFDFFDGNTNWRVSIATAIQKGALVDITKKIEREQKLNKLGIND